MRDLPTNTEAISYVMHMLGEGHSQSRVRSFFKKRWPGIRTEIVKQYVAEAVETVCDEMEFDRREAKALMRLRLNHLYRTVDDPKVKLQALKQLVDLDGLQSVRKADDEILPVESEDEYDAVIAGLSIQELEVLAKIEQMAQKRMSTERVNKFPPLVLADGRVIEARAYGETAESN